MAELDPQNVVFHEITGPTGNTPEQRIASVGEHLAELATRLQEKGRLLVWPPVEIENANGNTAGYIVPSVPAEQGATASIRTSGKFLA